MDSENDFLDRTAKAQVTIKIAKLDFMKIKKFCVSKDTGNKAKRQFTDWEKISANHETPETQQQKTT